MRRMILSLKDVLELAADMSRAGHPSEFIPYNASVRATVKDRPMAKLENVQIVLEWEEDLPFTVST